MRCDVRLLILLAALLMLGAAAVAPAADGADASEESEDDNAAEDGTAYGYTSDISNESGNTALAGVDVVLYTADRTAVSSMSTGADGRFEFQCTVGTGYLLTFTLEGYSVRSTGSHLAMDSDGYCAFTLEEAMKDDEGNYALTGTAESTSSVGMGLTTGTIWGTVTSTDDNDRPFNVRGAKATATSADGRTYSSTTDGDGYFEMTVASGRYTVKVTCSGFDDSGTVTVDTASSTSGLAIELTEKRMSLGIFGNLDAPHSLLVIGMIILAAVMLLSFVAYKRSQRPDSDISIVEDLNDEEDGEDVRRP